MTDAYLQEMVEGHNHPDFFFIEIGACDGRFQDPIYSLVTRYSWKGILVEPVPYLFGLMKHAYKGINGLHFENVAISVDDNPRMFSYIDPEKMQGLPDFSKAIGAFDIDVWFNTSRTEEQRKWFESEIRPRLKQIEVQCMTFQQLLDKYEVERIDLLQIDTEGYDFEIIKQVPFENVSPTIIHYENKYLQSGKEACANFLREHGYAVSNYGGNTLAVKKENE